MAKMEEPTSWGELDTVEFANWLEKYTEKTPSNRWSYKEGCALNIHDSISLFKELVNRLETNAEKISQLRKDLQEQMAEVEKLRQTVNNSDRKLLDKQAEIDGLNEQLQSEQEKIAQLSEKFDKPASLWRWLVDKFPNFFADGEATIQKLEKEIQVAKTQATQLQNKYNSLFSQFEGLENQQRQDKQSWSNAKKSLNDQLETLRRKNDEQMVEIARLRETKQAELVGDYEKHEGYQIVTAYKAFCTQQSLETMSEDIYNYLQRTKGSQDATERALFLAKIKSDLSKVLLVNTYKVQIRQLRNRQPLIEFQKFFESHIKKSSLSSFDLPRELDENLKRTAKKGFELVTELLKQTPPCLIFTADIGDMFNSEEHDIAIGCPKEGIIKFTVVPGILSGHQLLMKPVVFTEAIAKKATR